MSRLELGRDFRVQRINNLEPQIPEYKMIVFSCEVSNRNQGVTGQDLDQQYNAGCRIDRKPTQ